MGEIGEIIISNAKRSLTVNGVPHILAPKEFNLLYYLALNKGEFRSRTQIIADIWDVGYVGIRTIDVHISKIRKALGKKAIKTIDGVGYMLEADVKINDDLTDYEAHELSDGVNMGTYKGSNKSLIVVISIAKSKFGDLVIFVAGSNYHAMPTRDFLNSFKFVR